VEGSGKHILVVDDNLNNLQVTAKVLRENGYLISLAQDGKSALEMLNNLVPDLILLDIMMPEMDGLEVCRIIKQFSRLKEIPIIFLTARTQTEDIVEGFKAGGVDYIVKPFNRDEMLVRVRNHIELADSRKKIFEMNKNRDKLYSIIAHDIRSPLSSILFIIEAFKKNLVIPGSEEYQEMMDSLAKTTYETSTLLNNLLSWTKVQSQSITLTPKIINVSSVLNECVSLLKANADIKNITINCYVNEDFTAYMDEVTMHTVFRNILSNAIKFTPQDGSININAKEDKEKLILSFKDSGMGIPEDVIEKIMVHNQHHTSLGTANEQGSGLGLMMVKDFVSRNNGTLNIKSKIGEGAEIIISLPLEKPDDKSVTSNQ
jgi:two-component system sensor histidine kinase/response regulator